MPDIIRLESPSEIEAPGSGSSFRSLALEEFLNTPCRSSTREKFSGQPPPQTKEVPQAAESKEEQPPPARNTVELPTLFLDKTEAAENGRKTYPADSMEAKIYGHYKPAVVKIEASRIGRLKDSTDTSYGTGFFVDDKGLFFSVNHVVDGFDTVTIKTSDGKRRTAQVVERDRTNDLVLLKVTPAAGEKFRWIPLEAKDLLRMNQQLLVLGHPNGWDETYLRDGKIDGQTSVGMITDDLRKGEDGNRIVVSIAALGTNGDSGAPVIDMYGKVAGIADKANDPKSEKGPHLFMTKVEPMNKLLEKYRAALKD